MTQRELFKNYENEAKAPLQQAKSLPFAVYHDPDVYALEKDYVFHREWVFICAEQQLPKAGDCFALTLAGEAIVLIRGKDEQVRALSNICRHRGTPLLDEGFGTVERNIVCPYHAWAYDDQGNLKGAPHVGDIQLDKGEHCLPEFRLESWRGLLFINLDQQAQSLSTRLEGLDHYVDAFDWSHFTQGYRGEQEMWNANWKLAIENGIESYHLFKVHQETLEPLTPTKQSFYVAGSSEWTATAGKFVDKRSKLSKWLTGSYPEALNHYLLISLPPSFIGILSVNSFSWIQVLPKGPDQCEIRSGALAQAGGTDAMLREDPNISAFLEEDKHIVERVQKGMASTHTEGGKLVGMEQVVVDFHQFLASRLFDSQTSDFIETEHAALFVKD